MYLQKLENYLKRHYHKPNSDTYYYCRYDTIIHNPQFLHFFYIRMRFRTFPNKKAKPSLRNLVFRWLTLLRQNLPF